MVPPAATGSVRALAKPPVRKLAKDLGVDLGSVRATGPDGTVTRDDVQAAAGGASGVTESAGGARGGRTADRDQSQREHREPIKGVRKMMGQARSEARRVGNECVSKGRSRGAPDSKKNKEKTKQK